MHRDDSIKYHHIPSLSEVLEQGFVSQKLGVRKLASQLRVLVDKITDPVFCYEKPIEYARAYGLFIILIQTQDLSRKYIRHNLGEKRWVLIQEIILNVKEQIQSQAGLPKAEKKSEGDPRSKVDTFESLKK